MSQQQRFTRPVAMAILPIRRQQLQAIRGSIAASPGDACYAWRPAAGGKSRFMPRPGQVTVVDISPAMLALDRPWRPSAG